MGLKDWIRQAGAGNESDTDRNGFLSYHAEAHAVGVGLGAGFMLTLSGDEKLLGLVLAAISAGLRGESTSDKSRVYEDIVSEPHYAIGGVVVGAVLGWIIRGSSAVNIF